MCKTNNITVIIGGDFCPSGNMEIDLRKRTLAAADVVGSLRPLFEAGDIRVVNLECPLSERGTLIAKPSARLRAHPTMIELLQCLGADVVTLANNHVRDYGSVGVTDTLELCATKGIRTVGAGATLEAARQPLYVVVKGRRIAFVNAAEQEFANATATRAGANPLDLISVLQDLRQARSRADHVILIVHGGLEMTHVTSPESVRMLRFLAEQGVAAVVRHHSHFVQGVEVWKGVPIFYGLGNLLFNLDSRMPDGWYQGLVVALTISNENAFGVTLHPILQCDEALSVRLLDGEAKAQALRNIDVYSAMLANEQVLAKAWAEALKPIREHYLGLLCVPFWNVRRILMRLRLLRYFYPSTHGALCWDNLLRCDTHREVILDLLKSEHVIR